MRLISRKRWYIREEDQTGVALFGPFPPAEIEERLNDEYGKLFEDSPLVRVTAIRLKDSEVEGLTINPPQKWLAAAGHIRKLNALVADPEENE